MYETIKKKREEFIKKSKEIVFDLLEENGIGQITYTFEGQGDDGNFYMDEIIHVDETLLPNEESCKLFLEEPFPQYGLNENRYDKTFIPTVDDALNDLCNEILYLKNIDYCNGEGNSGNLVFDVKKREISITYYVSEQKTDYL